MLQAPHCTESLVKTERMQALVGRPVAVFNLRHKNELPMMPPSEVERGAVRFTTATSKGGEDPTQSCTGAQA